MSQTARADDFFGPADLSGYELARVPEAAASTGGEKFVRGLASSTYVHNSVGADQLLLEEYTRRIDEIEKQTGTRLPHPYTDSFDEVSELGFSYGIEGEITGRAGGGASPTVSYEEMVRRRRQAFEARTAALAVNHPGIETEDRFRARVEQRAADIQARMEGTGLAGFAGEVVGSFTDPVNVASLPIGGGSKTILGAAVREAGINAGVETVSQPLVGQNKARLGLEHSAGEALTNIGAAAVFGGVFGGTLKGAERAFARKSRREAIDAVEELPEAVRDDPDVQAARADLEKEFYTDEAADLIDSVDMEAASLHGEAVAAADEAVATGRLDLLPEEPGVTPLPPEGLPLQPVDRPAPVTPGIAGMEAIDPTTLQVDAKRFQFKSGGDTEGVTEALRDVEVWDPMKAGDVLVWEAADGARFVADGHQRTGLARRLKEQGQEVSLRGFILRESDGVSAEDARAIAAAKNIAQGTGTVIDAAKVLRVSPELIDGSLSPRTALFRDAMGLKGLGDDAFGMVVNEVVDPSQAALVGRLVSAPGEQVAILGILGRAKVRSAAEAEALIRDAIAAGFEKSEQVGLFGTDAVSESLLAERAKVLGGAVQRLRRDSRTFGTLSRDADTIENAGNTLDRQTNEELAQNAKEIADVVLRTATVTGPVSDALKRAVSFAREGGTTKAAIDRFISDLRDIGAEGLRGLDGPRGGAGGGRNAGDNAGPNVGPAGPRPDLAGRSAVAEDAGGLFDDPAAGAEVQRTALEGDAPDEPLLVGFTADEDGNFQPVTQTRQQLDTEIKAEDDMLARFEGCAYPTKGGGE